MNWRSVSISLSALALATTALAYRAGDTVRFHVIPRNLSGIATAPDALKAYVFKAGVCVDSTKSLAGGQITALPLATAHTARVYTWTWQIPASWGNDIDTYFTGVVDVICRYSTTADPIGQEWCDASPAQVPINFAVVDTLTAAAVSDFWNQYASSSTALIHPGSSGTPGSYGETWVSSSGQAVRGAIVRLCRDAAGAQVIGSATSDANGLYTIPVEVSPTDSNTFYLWAWFGNRVVKSAEVVTVP